MKGEKYEKGISHTICKFSHYLWIACESDCRNEGKRELKTHEAIQEVVQTLRNNFC